MKFADKTAIRSKIMISPLGIESQTFPLRLFLYWPITLVMASQERRRFWMARSSAWMSAGILDSMDCTLVTKSGTDSCAASDIPITVDISNVKYHCRARVSDWLCLSPAVLLQGKIASWVPSRGMTQLPAKATCAHSCSRAEYHLWHGETIHPAGQASPWKSELGKAASARSSCCYRVRNASPTLGTHEANMYRFSGVTELVRAE